MKPATSENQLLESLRTALDRPKGRYRKLNGATTLGDYLARDRPREDEEVLTEPLLADILERLLGFPADAYFPQLGRSGLKPDFTPHDLVAHRFVLDAKSSTQDLDDHEAQVRRYIDQRQLDYGVLFNLRELRVYRRGQRGHDRKLSFSVLHMWEIARGKALPDDASMSRLRAFVDLFRHRPLTIDDKIELIRKARSWTEREERGEVVEVDLDFLVDRLRDLSHELQEDAAAQRDQLERTLKVQPGRRQALLRELELIALDLAPGYDVDALPHDVESYATSDGLAGRVWRQYLLRVSQLALTRIMLYRSWEDVEFVDSYFYDGGFEQWYEKLDRDVRRVLNEAFAHGRERYQWLYGSDNNYDWYRPRDDAFVDVLYALVPVPLGKLDADILGGLYESYVDEIDRDRLGQFYTPRSVVRFMLDRAGYDGPEGIFRLEGDERIPRRLLDFATGSGGFLVEAARRVVDRGGLDLQRPADLFDALAAVVRGFHGIEISPFPYYLTEVNLLLQVSRILGAMRLAGADAPPFVLGVAHADTLSARPTPETSLEGLDAESRLDRGELMRDERLGLVPLDREKHEAFRRMRENGAFDLVVGNPPYVFESNNKILFDRLRALPAWRDDYHGKSDYLYYFLQLAAEKVAPGGRLCVITPAGWMNAGNADWLRRSLAETLRLDELFLFGSYRLFAPEQTRRDDRSRAPTPTVESAILVATKAPVPRDHELRVVALEDEAAAARALSDDAEARSPGRDALLEEMSRRATGRAGRRHGLHVHRVQQSRLDHAHPWPIKHGRKDVAARAVRHLDGQVSAAKLVERLDHRWEIVRGIETGADAYSQRIERTLPADIRTEIATRGAAKGEPILELPPGREHASPWKNYVDFLARTPESRALLYGAIDELDYTHLVWIDRDEIPPQEIQDELKRWRPLLAHRAEFRRNPRRRWYETAWARDKATLRKPKVIALYRTDRGRFSLDESGSWAPSNKATLCTAKEDDLSVAYLCGLLNSELLDLWYALRGKTPRDVWRNYEPKPMARIPYRHVPHIPAAGPRLAELESLLGEERADEALDLAQAIGDDTRQDRSDGGGEAAAALERIVRAIRSNRTALLPYRDAFPDLGAAVKDPWRNAPLQPDLATLIQSLPTSESLSLRVDPDVSIECLTDGTLGRAKMADGELVLRRGQSVTARVTGPPVRLALVETVVAGRRDLLESDLLGIRLPRDAVAFDALVAEQTASVKWLMDTGRLLVEAAERLVCALYAVPKDLEDEIVAHAVARAARATPSDD